MTKQTLAVALLITGLLAACATTTPTTIANPYPPIPPPMAETLPKPPVSANTLLWQPGHWDWNGSGYVWDPGEYVPAAGHGAMFQAGYWQLTPSGWIWAPAHWTS